MSIVPRTGRFRFPLTSAFTAGVAIMTLSALFASMPAYGASVRPTARMSSGPTRAEAYAQKIRAEFGLRSDLSYIRSIENEPGTSSQDLGTPLTPAESANIDARSILSTWAGTVDTASETQPGYAGEWIDQQAGGILRVAVAGTAAQTTYATLRGLLPTDAQVSFVQATYSLQELTQVQDQLTSEITGKTSLGIHIVESSVTPQYNAVTVALDPTVSSAQVAQLSAEYGSRVRIIQSAQGWVPQSSRDIDTGPIHGGIYVSSTLGDCTFGYGDFLNGAGQYYSITAGHCRGSSFYQGKSTAGPFVGQDHGNQYVPGGSSNCDCMGVGPLAADKVATGVLVNSNALFHFTHTAGKSEQIPGTPICISGAAEYESYGSILCGEVLSDEASIPYTDGSFTLIDATTTNISGTLAGDSGAPYGNGDAFIGIHGAQNTGLGETALTKAYNIAAALGGNFQY
jgi:hypothetical protein